MLGFLTLSLLTVAFANPAEKTVCEHKHMTIDCGGLDINVLSASYGRTQQDVCGRGGSTNCHADSSMSVARNECQGQTRCTLDAKNEAFGDPCVGTFKHLTVKYECVEKTVLVRICEGRSQLISCPAPKKIDITSANYGRLTGPHLCPGPVKTTNCGAAGSIDIVRSKCQEKQSCFLQATNGQFGDPCVGTKKYLEVKYECVEKTVLVRICEGRSQQISCPASKKIDITSANYGRLTGPHLCPGPVKTTNCGAAGSIDIVRSKCQEKQSCFLQATNGQFGDPCVGTKKYLEVKYECVEKTVLVRICEGRSQQISCPASKKIDITSANYGRLTGPHLCPGPVKTTNCGAAGSIDIVRSKCQEKQSCFLQATNGQFGDPCVGTKKYLEVKYECVEKTVLVRICEGRSQQISCPAPKEIDIMSANYGRLTGRHLCPGPVKTTNCGAAGSIDIVRNKCQGKQSCFLQATNGQFGDPCVGTRKYLEVKYECVEKTVLVHICEGRSQHISCPAPKKIDIRSANYGRLTGRHLCPGPVKTTNCGAAGSIDIARNKCQGKQSCFLQATNGQFGDPCVGTRKYLEIKYRCDW
nr:uncharacterized protein LOC131771431 isoform X2 [Pocillopora verrucosa]XP_058943209.1 uncharacterized protein LOC131771431 isoform X2 [Pocillopora verrucosa]